MQPKYISPKQDLDHVLRHSNYYKSDFQNAEILIYGGTGFIGTWIIESLIYSSFELGLNLQITCVTRDRKNAESRFRGVLAKPLRFIEHDFSVAEFNLELNADFVFHAATPTRITTGSSNISSTFTAAINAASHATSVKSRKFQKPRVLHLSSGAVYGVQPMDMCLRLESDPVVNFISPYVSTKLGVDSILEKATLEGKITYQSPRLFAFSGPLLQLDAHFAIGNFLRDGLANQPICINGNPETIRSYMYPADLVISLLSVATHEKYQNINIGSDVPISMFHLAKLISRMTENSEVKLADNYSEPTNYVPSITNLRSIIREYQFTNIEDSLHNWINWLKSRNH